MLPPVRPLFSSPLTYTPVLPTTLTSPPAVARYRPLTLNASATFDQQVTDNINSTTTGREADAISTVSLSLGLNEESRRTLLLADGTVGYQKFWTSSDFDNSGLAVNSYGRGELIDQLLFVDGNFSTGQAFVNPALAPASNRASTAARTQITTYDAGSYITFDDLFNYLDVYLRARKAWVDFRGIAGATTPLPNATLEQERARISTNAGIRPYQMIASGENVRQQDGFRLYNGIFSLLLGQATGSQIIGRIGYENVQDIPSNVDIQGLLWSAGWQWRSAKNTSVRIEYGHRYGKPTWNGSAIIALTPKVYLIGNYLRTLESFQARLNRSLTDLIDQPTDESVGISALNPVQPPILNGLLLTDDATFGLSWLIDAPVPQSVLPDLAATAAAPVTGVPQIYGAGSRLSLVAGYSHPRRISLAQETKDYQITGTYTRGLRRKLSLGISFSYIEDHLINPAGPTSKSYRVSPALVYEINRSAAASLSYSRLVRATNGGGRVSENVVEFTIGTRL